MCYDGNPRWVFYKVIKSFGRLIIKSCDDIGKIDKSSTGRELITREYSGYIKKAK